MLSHLVDLSFVALGTKITNFLSVSLEPYLAEQLVVMYADSKEPYQTAVFLISDKTVCINCTVF